MPATEQPCAVQSKGWQTLGMHQQHKAHRLLQLTLHPSMRSRSSTLPPTRAGSLVRAEIPVNPFVWVQSCLLSWTLPAQWFSTSLTHCHRSCLLRMLLHTNRLPERHSSALTEAGAPAGSPHAGQQHGVEDAALHAAREGPSAYVMDQAMSCSTARACQRLQAFQAAAYSPSPSDAMPGSPAPSSSHPTSSPTAQPAAHIHSVSSTAMGSLSPSKQRKRRADDSPVARGAAVEPGPVERAQAEGQDADLSQQSAPVRVGSDPLAGGLAGDDSSAGSR